MRNIVRELGRIICLGIALSTLSAHAAELDEAILKLLEEDEPAARRTEPLTPTPAPKSRAPGTSSRDGTSGAMPLTLAEAERMAQENDAISKSLREKAGALGDQSIAAGRWPDPKLKLGISEYPLRPAEDGQTTIRMVVGLQQAMIPPARRAHESAQLQLMGQGQSARVTEQKLLVLRETRKAWLNVFLQHHTSLIVKQTHKLLGQLN